MIEDESKGRDARYTEHRELIHSCLGLAGEAGEVVDLIKKSVSYGTPIYTGHLLEECGDTLHYLARILDYWGFTLEDAKKHNLDKLHKRFPNGYSNKDAIERNDK